MEENWRRASSRRLRSARGFDLGLEEGLDVVMVVVLDNDGEGLEGEEIIAPRPPVLHPFNPFKAIVSLKAGVASKDGGGGGVAVEGVLSTIRRESRRGDGKDERGLSLGRDPEEDLEMEVVGLGDG